MTAQEDEERVLDRDGEVEEGVASKPNDLQINSAHNDNLSVDEDYCPQRGSGGGPLGAKYYRIGFKWMDGWI